jgi:hypothetical protein
MLRQCLSPTEPTELANSVIVWKASPRGSFSFTVPMQLGSKYSLVAEAFGMVVACEAVEVNNSLVRNLGAIKLDAVPSGHTADRKADPCSCAFPISTIDEVENATKNTTAAYRGQIEHSFLIFQSVKAVQNLIESSFNQGGHIKECFSAHGKTLVDSFSKLGPWFCAYVGLSTFLVTTIGLVCFRRRRHQMRQFAEAFKQASPHRQTEVRRVFDDCIIENLSSSYLDSPKNLSSNLSDTKSHDDIFAAFDSEPSLRAMILTPR